MTRDGTATEPMTFDELQSIVRAKFSEHQHGPALIRVTRDYLTPDGLALLSDAALAQLSSYYQRSGDAIELRSIRIAGRVTRVDRLGQH